MITAKGPYFVKNPTDELDFSPSWVSFLGTDTIVTSTWDVPAGLNNLGADVNEDGNVTQIILGGGVAGSEYQITNTIVTNNSIKKSRSFYLQILAPALASNALITLEYLKTHIKRYSNYPEEDVENPLLMNLINSVSARFERYCNRTFKAADYVQRVEMDEETPLNNYPAAYVSGIYTDTRECFTLRNAAANAVDALAWVGPDRKLYLKVVGGASHGLETIDLTDVDTDDLGELIAAINALTTGWSATLNPSFTGYERCEDLVEQTARRVSSQGLGVTMLGLPSDMPYFFDSRSGIITFGNLADAFEPVWAPAYGFDRAFLDRYTRTAWVKYRGGFETIPADLQMLAARAVSHVLSTPRDAAINYELFGDYAYSRSTDSEVSKSVMSFEKELEEWRSQAI